MRGKRTPPRKPTDAIPPPKIREWHHWESNPDRSASIPPSPPYPQQYTFHHVSHALSSVHTTHNRPPSSVLSAYVSLAAPHFAQIPHSSHWLPQRLPILQLRGGRNGRSPRKASDQRHRPARFPHADSTGLYPRPGIEPGSTWLEASRLIAQPPRPQGLLSTCIQKVGGEDREIISLRVTCSSLDSAEIDDAWTNYKNNKYSSPSALIFSSLHLPGFTSSRPFTPRTHRSPCLVVFRRRPSFSPMSRVPHSALRLIRRLPATKPLQSLQGRWPSSRNFANFLVTPRIFLRRLYVCRLLSRGRKRNCYFSQLSSLSIIPGFLHQVGGGGEATSSSVFGKGGSRLLPNEAHDLRYSRIHSNLILYTRNVFGNCLPACKPQQESNCKIDFKRVYTEVSFAIGSEFIRHALDDTAPIADMQRNKKRIPYCQIKCVGNTGATAKEQIPEVQLYKGLSLLIGLPLIRHTLQASATIIKGAAPFGRVEPDIVAAASKSYVRVATCFRICTPPTMISHILQHASHAPAISVTLPRANYCPFAAKRKALNWRAVLAFVSEWRDLGGS
ncbi:hypothetical protein PR048_012161 [Dryococelus australis]|uniref:Uncharacterized protein n=1 Tax=Dryococelus australis TaxID=614101 RepID=A0ABQ9HP59_9NEOP|nr:hypothetical protein PR048_012161 [Dryococelus australis]